MSLKMLTEKFTSDYSLKHEVERACDDTAGQTVLLELGVGFNTPVIIRFPFEQMAARLRNVKLVRANPTQTAPLAAHPDHNHLIVLRTDAATAINALG